ncbi:GRF zinc finger containing protein [Striga asiatica]|uniref:GRF zinc finger containing protein n=1 Tax=Striga asiatica TaxID=4170 RepID=A0A5A7Q4Y8_STRAF|nr:GRF zinc finger containing protein [Striga asiatica]
MGLSVYIQRPPPLTIQKEPPHDLIRPLQPPNSSFTMLLHPAERRVESLGPPQPTVITKLWGKEEEKEEEEEEEEEEHAEDGQRFGCRQVLRWSSSPWRSVSGLRTTSPSRLASPVPVELRVECGLQLPAVCGGEVCGLFVRWGFGSVLVERVLRCGCRSSGMRLSLPPLSASGVRRRGPWLSRAPLVVLDGRVDSEIGSGLSFFYCIGLIAVSVAVAWPGFVLCRSDTVASIRVLPQIVALISQLHPLKMSYASRTSPNSQHSASSNIPVQRLCGCLDEADVFTSGTDDNPCRRFYKCPNRKVKDCGLFDWIDPALPEFQRTCFIRLKAEKKALEEKLRAMEKQHNDRSGVK